MVDSALVFSVQGGRPYLMTHHNQSKWTDGVDTGECCRCSELFQEQRTRGSGGSPLGNSRAPDLAVWAWWRRGESERMPHQSARCQPRRSQIDCLSLSQVRLASLPDQRWTGSEGGGGRLEWIHAFADHCKALFSCCGDFVFWPINGFYAAAFLKSRPAKLWPFGLNPSGESR